MSNELPTNSADVSGSYRAFAPRFIIDSEPVHRIFLSNLVDVVFPRRTVPHPHTTDGPAFWSDVFVSSELPWGRLLQSFALHGLLMVAFWGASRAWLSRPQVFTPPAFSKRDVIYFPASEYLPALDTGRTKARVSVKGEPAFSKQAILSVPPEADNRRQTVVTVPDVKINADIPLPNVVAWKSVTPAAPISAVSRLTLPTQPETVVVEPPPTVERAADRRRMDVPSDAAIAPAPEFVSAAHHRQLGPAPQPSVIEPPPGVQGQMRQFGDISIAHSEVVPPAPQLPISEQRAMNSRGGYVRRSLATDVVPPPPTPGSDQGSGFRARGGTRTSANVVPPPPSVLGGNSNSRIVALGLNPAAGAPPIATGNRRGTFVLSSAGKRGAAGTPEINAGGEGGGSNGESARRSDLPAGLVVKPIPNSASVAQPRTGGARSGDMIADSKPPLRVTTIPRGAVVTTSTPTAEEREVFGDRKFYSMTLNMPNLNSAGGSWVIRFAELKNSTQQGDLIAPEATRKVDPAYPLELMRTQVQGKVTLYAVIRSDGSVGDVRVLTSVDDRLDEYARAALSHWRFQAATKAGNPIDLEAVITIPFQVRSAF